MITFTSDFFSFISTLDSKGRITIPSEVRKKLNLQSGERLFLSVESPKVKRFEVSDFQEAKKIIDQYERLRYFKYMDKILEVVVDER